MVKEGSPDYKKVRKRELLTEEPFQAPLFLRVTTLSMSVLKHCSRGRGNLALHAKEKAIM